jgi:hypothetical protein
MNAPNTAEDILSAMAGVYTRCRSYRDVGTVTTHTFPDNRDDYLRVRRFSTAFIRPDRFRFEFREHYFCSVVEHRVTMWAFGEEVRCEVDEGDGNAELKSWSSLRNLLMAHGGTSGRVSWVVPFLFLPGWGDGRCWHLSELARLDDDRIGDVECYRVQGRFAVTPGHDGVCQQAVRENVDPKAVWTSQMSPITFWVERERLLLRRFACSGRIMNSRLESTTEYQPEIDAPITDAEVTFGDG